MFKKLILLSSILTILSIAPVRAQYSFAKIYGGGSDDRPYGMFQLSNGNFIFYGYYSGNSSGANYIGCIDKFGNLLWEKQSTNQYGNDSRDGFESDSKEIYIAGNSQVNFSSPSIIKMTANGTIVFDTVFRLNDNYSGSIFKAVYDNPKKEIVSIGTAGKFNNSYILFHKASYSGQQLSYKFINFPHDLFRLKNFFKVRGKDEYLVFGQREVIRLDSVGNQIDSVQSIGESSTLGSGVDIRDITQNEDGTFTSVLTVIGNDHHGYYLQAHNKYGLFDTILVKLATLDSGFVNTVTTTRDKGFFVAGEMFYRVDSNGTVLWSKRSYQPKDAEMVSVKQALDGGFYGCALDFAGVNDINMYVFKTTPEGEIKTGLNNIYRHTLNIKVMPNPSEGVFTLSGEIKNAQVSLTNLLGQTVVAEHPLAENGTMDASSLKAGIYILTVTDQHNSYVEKINIVK